jgi:acyl carrier protein
MASRDEIFGWVSEVLRDEFDFAPEELRLETHLIDELDLDSIDAIDMAVRLEERTSLAFSDQDLKNLRTIGDVVDLIHGRL